MRGEGALKPKTWLESVVTGCGDSGLCGDLHNHKGCNMSVVCLVTNLSDLFLWDKGDDMLCLYKSSKKDSATYVKP